MAAIVLIHGINNQRSAADVIEKDWLPALCGGIHNAKGKEFPVPAKSDVEVAFWGSYFRKPAQRIGMSLDLPPLHPGDLTEPGEHELLRMLLRHAEEIGAVPSSDGAMSVGGSNWMHSAIRKLAGSIFFRAMYGEKVEKILIWSVKQLNAYMYDIDNAFNRVQEKVQEAIAEDTRVVIGHSLGSVIAYEALLQNPKNVITLVTLGSPLGVPTVIYDRLRPLDAWVSHEGRRVRRKPDVKNWRNFAEPWDLVALVKNLAPLFEPGIEDWSVSTGRHDPHHPIKYLTDAEVGRAICTGWPPPPWESP